jgi:hypothetical protein
MSTDYQSLEKARESFMGLKKTPPALEPRELRTSLLEDPFNGHILEQVTDILMLLLRKDSSRGLSLKDVLDSLERNVLVTALSDCNGHQISAAKFLREAEEASREDGVQGNGPGHQRRTPGL